MQIEQGKTCTMTVVTNVEQDPRDKTKLRIQRSQLKFENGILVAAMPQEPETLAGLRRFLGMVVSN